MKKKVGLYSVHLGYHDPTDGSTSDSWRSHDVLATDALEAARKLKLDKGEFISQVKLVGRED